jgi:hypothetical protein
MALGARRSDFSVHIDVESGPRSGTEDAIVFANTSMRTYGDRSGGTKVDVTAGRCSGSRRENPFPAVVDRPGT